MLPTQKKQRRLGGRVLLARILVILAILQCFSLPVTAASSYVTSNGHVYLRKAASTDSDIVLVLKPNARLLVVETAGDWYKVEYGRKTGYVRQDVVTAEGESASAATAPAASTAAPATTGAAAEITYKTLSKGSSGDEVFRLQEALIYTSYFDAMPDSKYGDSTVAAVKAYQKDNNLFVDGIAGDKTQKMLLAEPAYLEAKGINSPVSEETTPVAEASYNTLKYGDSGEEVRAMQVQLISLGYLTGSATGNFRSDTQTAVKYFQEKNGVTADGIAGKKTLAILYSGTAIAKNPGVIIDVAEADAQSALKLGSKGDAVKSLQNRLIELKYLTGRADGTFGSQTETALKLFQQQNGLTADGVAGTKTQTALFSTGATASGGTSGATTGTLKRDSQGDEVKNLQTQLKSLKYYDGAITGNFGALTEKSVIAFQKANGLTADGIAGSGTLTKLYSGSAVAASGSSGSATASETQPGSSAGSAPSAASVQNVNWYSGIRNKYKAGTQVTIYDFETGLSWKCRFMSNGKHADSEPMTSQDTEIMYRAFGKKNTWTPKAVWVIMPDGNVFIASLHNVPHLSGSIKDNNFDGHLCIHFPRDMEEAEGTGPYAVSHQNAIIKGWEKTQKLAGR